MSDKPIHIDDFRMEMFATNKKATDHHNIGEQTYHILLDGNNTVLFLNNDGSEGRI
ncbi:hypothetical protein [Parageobacillus toebii]|uniref:hypothetical protein n=1 Tax=Parageobacillus toebii TaxID=153151 RepID=UPI0035B56119